MTLDHAIERTATNGDWRVQAGEPHCGRSVHWAEKRQALSTTSRIATVSLATNAALRDVLYVYHLRQQSMERPSQRSRADESRRSGFAGGTPARNTLGRAGLIVGTASPPAGSSSRVGDAAQVRDTIAVPFRPNPGRRRHSRRGTRCRRAWAAVLLRRPRSLPKHADAVLCARGPRHDRRRTQRARCGPLIVALRRRRVTTTPNTCTRSRRARAR